MKHYLKSGLIAGGLAVALTAGVFIGQASAYQPHMQAALASLQNARSQLEMAVPDKGGHRVRAIDLTDQAIAETRAGIQYANH